VLSGFIWQKMAAKKVCLMVSDENHKKKLSLKLNGFDFSWFVIPSNSAVEKRKKFKKQLCG
jgi:hypothetical protein